MLITDPSAVDFESYASVADLRSLADRRGYEIPVADDECEKLLIQAMDYLEGMRWKGTRAFPDQPLAWPRTCVVVDRATFPGTAIPKQLIQAQCRLAVEAQEKDLQPSFAGGAEVLQESVAGVVSVTYAEGSRAAAPSFSWLDGLLRGMVAGSGQISVVRG